MITIRIKPDGYKIEGPVTGALHSLDDLRKVETVSIREFVESACDWLTGRVLDFGAGKPGTCRTPEPYRNMVDGEYVPVDLGDTIPPGPYDAILCTQVIQCLFDPFATFQMFARLLAPNGRLVMTYPTLWPELTGEADIFRFTRQGVTKLLWEAGLVVQRHEERAAIVLGSNRMAIGYGVVASLRVQSSPQSYSGIIQE